MYQLSTLYITYLTIHLHSDQFADDVDYFQMVANLVRAVQHVIKEGKNYRP